ncbi:aldehyde dehydrogenase family protein [Saccharothrix xinjiangensis]|uniref:Aldehyde dehydrogenase family protein n=1 Tax=Saccharothrix xinjiangensis TaxID=204798 RepID=A0ABV9YGB4_9PSEU
MTAVDLVDPRTGRVRGQLEHSTADRVREVVGAARRAATGWADLVPAQRCARLAALARRIVDAADEYVAAEVAGTGKPEREARSEVLGAAELFDFYAWAARADQGPAAGHLVPGHESWVRWEPLGVVAAVLPWNYPVMMAAWRCAPALAAGNAVVLKPAPTTPDSAALLARDAAEALGPDVLRVVQGGRETGRHLVSSGVGGVAFTGSSAGGADVAARAGVARVSLELGGNCPCVVLPDAPEPTWDALADAVTYNAGQSCAAPARVIALRSDHDRVVELLAKAVGERVAGTSFGPLNNPDQVARYDRLVGGSAARARAVSPTATDDGTGGGFWRPAVVLSDVDDDDIAVREEVFGPVLTVQAADDLDHAVRLANGQPQALAASVWTSSLADGIGLAGRVDAGEVWVNCHLVQTPELPHGGRRGSGSGTDLSVLALREYQRPKTITVNLGGDRGVH